MRLGISTFAYAWAIGAPGRMPTRPMTALDLLDRARSLGVGLVQVADNLPLDGLSPSELEAFESRARDYGIAMEVGTRGIARDHLLTYLRLADRFSSPILRVVIDKGKHEPGPDEIVRLLKPVMPEFERAGVILAIENHDRFPSPSLVDIIHRLDSGSAGICLDTVNSFGCMEGPEVVVKALGPYTVNLHVKEFSIRRPSSGMGFLVEGAPAGRGKLDVPWLLAELRAMGRDPNAILEQWPTPEADLEATIAKETAWAEEGVRYLRTLIRDEV